MFVSLHGKKIMRSIPVYYENGSHTIMGIIPHNSMGMVPVIYRNRSCNVMGIIPIIIRIIPIIMGNISIIYGRHSYTGIA